MGYQVYIEKKSNQKIELDSWIKFLESNKEFEKRDYFQGTNPNTGEILSHNSPNSAVWKIDNLEIPFSYYNGTISVTNPNGKAINKMLEIADLLDAEVVGFEGEKYSKSNKKWWKFW